MKSTFLSLTKMSSDLTVKVAVENTTYVFDKLFDYLVPSAFTDLVQVGKRVLVPFGRGNKKKQGIIFELSPVSDDIPVEKLKSICSLFLFVASAERNENPFADLNQIGKGRRYKVVK